MNSDVNQNTKGTQGLLGALLVEVYEADSFETAGHREMCVDYQQELTEIVDSVIAGVPLDEELDEARRYLSDCPLCRRQMTECIEDLGCVVPEDWAAPAEQPCPDESARVMAAEPTRISATRLVDWLRSLFRTPILVPVGAAAAIAVAVLVVVELGQDSSEPPPLEIAWMGLEPPPSGPMHLGSPAIAARLRPSGPVRPFNCVRHELHCVYSEGEGAVLGLELGDEKIPASLGFTLAVDELIGRSRGTLVLKLNGREAELEVPAGERLQVVVDVGRDSSEARVTRAGKGNEHETLARLSSDAPLESLEIELGVEGYFEFSSVYTDRR